MTYTTPELTLVGSAAGLVLGSKIDMQPISDNTIYGGQVPPGFDASKAYDLGADSNW
jgi:hypothetical protein